MYYLTFVFQQALILNSSHCYYVLLTHNHITSRGNSMMCLLNLRCNDTTESRDYYFSLSSAVLFLSCLLAGARDKSGVWRHSCVVLIRPKQVSSNLREHLQKWVRQEWTQHLVLRPTLSSKSLSRSSNVLSMVIRRKLLTSLTPPALKCVC
jgi:hypothetical protein